MIEQQGSDAPQAPAASEPVATTEHSTSSEPEVSTAQPKPERSEVPRSFTNRIGALTRRVDSVTREAATERAQREMLERELAQYRQASGQQAQQPQQRDSQVDLNQIRAQEKENVRLEMKVADVLKASSAIPNFEQSVMTLNSLGMSDKELSLILDGDEPAKVLAHLGANPDKAEELFAMRSGAMGRALAKIEQSLTNNPRLAMHPSPSKPNAAEGTDTALQSEPKHGSSSRTRPMQSAARDKELSWQIPM